MELESKTNDITLSKSKGREHTNPGFLTTYRFKILILNVDFFYKLAVDYRKNNLYRIISPETLKGIFGEYHYEDLLDPLNLSGSINLKLNDSNYKQKFELFKKKINNKMKSLAFYEYLDYEIAELHWSSFNLKTTEESSFYYEGSNKEQDITHAKYDQIRPVMSTKKLFKYSINKLYEDCPTCEKKILEGLNSNNLKINYLYYDILPFLKGENYEETKASEETIKKLIDGAKNTDLFK